METSRSLASFPAIRPARKAKYWTEPGHSDTRLSNQVPRCRQGTINTTTRVVGESEAEGTLLLRDVAAAAVVVVVAVAVVGAGVVFERHPLLDHRAHVSETGILPQLYMTIQECLDRSKKISCVGVITLGSNTNISTDHDGRTTKKGEFHVVSNNNAISTNLPNRDRYEQLTITTTCNK